MIKNLTPLILFFIASSLVISTIGYSQDTTKTKITTPNATVISKDTAKSAVISPDSIKKADPKPEVVDNDTTNTGISVSPSTLRFNVKPGSQQTKTIKVTNDTRKPINFQINFQDFGAGADGKESVGLGTEFHNSLSKYIVVSPTLIELKPHEKKIISVTIDIPPGDEYAIAMWTTLIIDQIIDRPKLETPDVNKTALSLGVNTGIGFGINIHQNPPNVVVNNVEIKSLRYEKGLETAGNSVVMKAKNTGDGIGYCLYYIELTNLLTGKQTKLKVKQFGLLPGYEKELPFELPKELEKGKYSVLAVLDFGNKEELQTAELEFTID